MSTMITQDMKELLKAQDSWPVPSVLFCCDHAAMYVYKNEPCPLLTYCLANNPEPLTIKKQLAGWLVGTVRCNQCHDAGVKPRCWIRVK